MSQRPPLDLNNPRNRGRFIGCARCCKQFWVPPCVEKKGRKYCSNECMRLAQGGSADPVEAFWLKVDKGPHPKGCWLYTGFIKWDGYGWLARTKGHNKIRYMTAHRYSWILANGEPPKGMHILHRCDVAACCNPAHLWLGTHADNMADMKAKGRTSKGFRSKGHAVLHPDRVRPVKQPL